MSRNYYNRNEVGSNNRWEIRWNHQLCVEIFDRFPLSKIRNDFTRIFNQNSIYILKLPINVIAFKHFICQWWNLLFYQSQKPFRWSIMESGSHTVVLSSVGFRFSLTMHSMKSNIIAFIKNAFQWLGMSLNTTAAAINLQCRSTFWVTEIWLHDKK